MKINVYSIQKNDDKYIKAMIDEYIKMSLVYAKVKDHALYEKSIKRIKSENEAKKMYTKLFMPYLDGLNISLDPKGEELDSYAFANILNTNTKINFFIGGAYGLEENFLKKTQRVLSLSQLTYAHKIAKLVLHEQIYRGLSILNNHPYHK